VNEPVTIQSRRILLDDVFRVDEAWVQYPTASGELTPPVRRLCFERGDSAAALVVNTERQTCVLAEQFRYPAHRRGSSWLVELPAGIVDPGESAEDSIRRELVEEIGYRAGEMVHIATYFPSPGGSSERMALFCALVTDADHVAAGGGHASEGEFIAIREMPLAEVDQALAEGRIVDGKTLLALTWLQLRVARGQLRLGGST
jgi:ADP-ribose pyrophosphatase